LLRIFSLESGPLGGGEMKWKDTGDMAEKEETKKEGYFDEEQYSPWAMRHSSAIGSRLSKIPLVLILLGLAIATLVAALFMIVLSSHGGSVSPEQIAALEGRMQQLEDRLDKYEAIDEKVTRIWEQAKSFEKFKDRFDRSEASMTLRMDHLTMSLEALQKQLLGGPPKLSPIPTPTPSAPDVKTEKTADDADTNKAAAQEPQYHIVASGDTFFNISRRYDISVEELLKLNHMEKDSVLQIGQKLTIRDGSH
jgi:LysM repeat protein